MFALLRNKRRRGCLFRKRNSVSSHASTAVIYEQLLHPSRTKVSILSVGHLDVAPVVWRKILALLLDGHGVVAIASALISAVLEAVITSFLVDGAVDLHHAGILAVGTGKKIIKVLWNGCGLDWILSRRISFCD